MARIVHDLASSLSDLEAALAGMPESARPLCVTQLHGYLTAVVLCPDPISPSDWLPAIYGETNTGATPTMKDPELLGHATDHVMKLYNRIFLELEQPGKDFAPILDVEKQTGNLEFYRWLEGFSIAVSLHWSNWPTITSFAEDGMASALITLMDLAAYDEQELGNLGYVDSDAIICDTIPACIAALNHYRRQRSSNSRN